MRLPLSLYPPPVKVMLPKAVPGAKSLKLLVSRPAPAGKTRSSPGLGATLPIQLPPAVQLFEKNDPPSQVTIAGSVRCSRVSMPRRERVDGRMVRLREGGAERLGCGAHPPVRNRSRRCLTDSAIGSESRPDTGLR